MDAVLSQPLVGSEPSLMEDIRDKVFEVEKSVVRLTTNHEHLMEAVNRIELSLQAQNANSKEYRDRLLEEVGAVTALVRTVESNQVVVNHRISKFEADLERLRDQQVLAFLRKNAAVIAVGTTVLMAIIGLIRWMVIHYR